MMRREQTCGNQDGERRKKRERVWLSDSVNPGLGSLPLIPLFPLIKTAELPLISSLSLSISSFLPSLSPPPPAPNPLLQSFLFFFPHFFLSQGSHRPASGKSRLSQKGYSFSFFFFFFLFLLLSRACSSFLPLSPCFFPSSESIISAMILEQ